MPTSRRSVTKKSNHFMNAVDGERLRQEIRWGQQDHPSDVGTVADQKTEAYYKRLNKEAVAEGNLSWRLILLEEVYEAIASKDIENLKVELVQVAAVCRNWFENLERRGKL